VTAKASDKLKLARGTVRKDRADRTIKVDVVRPKKPKWLGDIASSYWDETVKLLESEKQLLPCYGDFITQYSIAWQDFHKADRVIEEEGEYCHSEKGGVYQHPAVGVRNKAIERIGKFGRQLGLSGQSIKHVQKTEGKEAASTKGRFFGKQA